METLFICFVRSLWYTYLTSTKPNRLQAKISNWLSFFFLIKSADTNKKRDKNTDRCSMVTFWKVAALPCTGVLAPICSCWHKANSFSISVITTVFSSSTNWNRERYTQREGGMCFRTEDTFYNGTSLGELICAERDSQGSWSNTNQASRKEVD